MLSTNTPSHAFTPPQPPAPTPSHTPHLGLGFITPRLVRRINQTYMRSERCTSTDGALGLLAPARYSPPELLLWGGAGGAVRGERRGRWGGAGGGGHSPLYSKSQRGGGKGGAKGEVGGERGAGVTLLYTAKAKEVAARERAELVRTATVPRLRAHLAAISVL